MQNIHLCNKKECQDILNDKEKISEIIEKKQQYYCFHYWSEIIKKNDEIRKGKMMKNRLLNK